MKTNTLIYKVALLFLFVIFHPKITIAQTNLDSKAILDKVSNTFEKSDGVRLSFTLGFDTPNGFESQNGEVFLKGDKFKLELPTSTVWFDGTTQWILLHELDEVNISTPSKQELLSISPLVILNIYKSGYDVKEPIKRTYKGNPVLEIVLNSNDNKKELTSITLLVDNESYQIKQINITTRDNKTTQLSLSHYTYSKLINDLFIFNKHNYPNVEIVDLR